MLIFTQYLPESLAPCQYRLTLDYDARKKSRQRLQLDSGEEIALRLPRGVVVRGGDHLQTDDGIVAKVVAAAEEVSTASCDEPLLFARACYHLGNRHVPLQIGLGWLRYQRDHVLDQMVEQLGLKITPASLPFEPEEGAFAHTASHHHG